MNPCSVRVYWTVGCKAMAALAVQTGGYLYARSGRGEWWLVHPDAFPFGGLVQHVPGRRITDRARVMKFEAALSAAKVYRAVDRSPLAVLGCGDYCSVVLP